MYSSSSHSPADDLGRHAHRDHAIGARPCRRQHRARGDQASLADPRLAEQRRRHPTSDPGRPPPVTIAPWPIVTSSAISFCTSVSQWTTALSCTFHPPTESHRRHVAANHGPEPERRPLAGGHVTGQYRRRCQVNAAFGHAESNSADHGNCLGFGDVQIKAYRYVLDRSRRSVKPMTAGLRESKGVQASVEELVARSRMHDAEAFAELIRRFEGIALSIAYARLRNAADAGDVVQDAFLRAWQKIDSLEDAARFGHWLGRMVRNLAIDFHRRKRPGLLEGDVASGHAAVSTPMEVAERRRQIDDALEELDDMSRQCVVMRYFENLSSRRSARR
jgi:RNA polymerase sigma-70 factor (ECF subfamily)